MATKRASTPHPKARKRTADEKRTSMSIIYIQYSRLTLDSISQPRAGLKKHSEPILRRLALLGRGRRGLLGRRLGLLARRHCALSRLFLLDAAVPVQCIPRGTSYEAHSHHTHR